MPTKKELQEQFARLNGYDISAGKKMKAKKEDYISTCYSDVYKCSKCAVTIKRGLFVVEGVVYKCPTCNNSYKWGEFRG